MKKKIISPWKMHYHIEKYDRGHWFTSMINREIPDFCKVIADPKAPWRLITSHLKKNKCPYDAGSAETFDMEPISHSQLPDYINFSMTGRYRVTFTSIFTDEDGSTNQECWKAGFEVMPN